MAQAAGPATAGPSNSHPALKNERSTEAGIDTWSVCWYLVDESPACRAMESLATIPAKRSRLIDTEIVGHKVGWFPGSRLLFAEGHPSTQGLCKARDLPGALHAVAEGLADLGVIPPAYALFPEAGPHGPNAALGGSGFGGVRRLDATVDLVFDRPSEGLAALSGVAAMALPRVKTETIREAGGRRIETVYLLGPSGRSVLGRWYDKGIESGSAARGLHIRPEQQGRFAKDARPTVDVIAQTSYVRDAFVKRFEPLWRAAKGVKVAGRPELTEKVIDLVETGEISPQAAQRMIGHVFLDGNDRDPRPESTARRHRAECRDHGLVIADGVDDEVEVDLGEVLEQAMEAEAWGAQG